jgi:hypothetical protein
MRLVHGVLWVVLAAGCNKPAAPAATSAGAADPAAKGPSANLTVSEAEALLKSNPMAQLIDVRTLSEWSGGYIAGAKHIPLDQIETRLPEIDKSRTVVLYCAAGRSEPSRNGDLEGGGLSGCAPPRRWHRGLEGAGSSPRQVVARATHGGLA